jgi:antitoxin component of MazEF toxin-antitoxin module
MKKIFILILFVSSLVSAQKKDFKYALSGIKKVVINSDTTIKVEVGNTQELIISENKRKHGNDDDCDDCDDEKHENHFPNKKNGTKKSKREGLTAIYPGGKDDTNGYGFSVLKEENVLYISDLKSHFQRHGLFLKLPKNIDISVNSGNLGSIYLEGFTGEVEAKSNVGRIEMKNVTGPITANTSVGKIDIDFDKVSQSSPITIRTSVSEIDVALPANTNADLEIRTQGTVFTNFDFKIPKKKGLQNVSGRKNIVSKLNNGGVKIYIKSSMGNIYLRKK